MCEHIDIDDELKEIVITKEEGKRLSNLWKDNAIQNIFSKRNEYYGVSDSTEHFFSKINDIVSEQYKPDDKDVFLVRHHTTGTCLCVYVRLCLCLCLLDC